MPVPLEGPILNPVPITVDRPFGVKRNSVLPLKAYRDRPNPPLPSASAI